MFYKSSLWLIIWAYIALTYLSLPFMRGILRTIKTAIGDQSLGIALNVTLALAGLSLAFLAKRVGWRHLLLATLPLAIIATAAYSLDIPEERMHYLQYGLLGVLLAKTARLESWFRSVQLALFAVLIGFGDELIQWWLPNRVGEWRDVTMNASAGVLGLWIGITLFWQSGWLSTVRRVP